MLVVGVIFTASNAAFLYYLFVIVPTLDASPPAVENIALGIVLLGVFQVLQHITGFGAAPTGKFNTGVLAVKLTLPVNVAWWTMEQPSFLVPVVMLTEYVRRGHQINAPGPFFLGMFIVHYFQRSLIYPWLSRGSPYPVHAWASAMLFTVANGTMQSLDLLYYRQQYGGHTLYSLRVALGCFIFMLGMFINIHSDFVLRNLRKRGETAYKIPRGGMFEYVSGAHFVGEIVEWTGVPMPTPSDHRAEVPASCLG